MEPFWSEANGHAPHSVKYESEATVSSFPYCTESSLNFSTSATAYSEDDTEYATGRRNKTSRQDPLSHRIIEKRRRDRMNSCLADLSRLIPPQYQRKGRGRIEKTEIIEMAIRHLKHLQNECMLKENEYRMGYMDCMKETAKFLYDSQLQDCLLARLLTRLQEHCEEVLKNDCYKSRGCLAPDNVSGSSGSPHQAFHAAAPLCQLRDMLGGAASASDIEHSNDHNDVKDLSFRNHLNQLQRAVAASAAAAAAAHSTNNVNKNNSSNVKITNNNNIINNNNMNNNNNASDNKISQMRLVASPTQSVAIVENAPTSTTSNLNLAGDGINNNITPSVLCQQQSQQQQQQQHKPNQTPVITSTAVQHTAHTQHLHAAHTHHNADTSSQDFESSREHSFVHASDTSSNMHSPPPPPDTFIPHAHQHSQNAHSQPLPAHLNNHHSQLSQHSNASDSALSLRLRNYSESSSHEIEHINNNYKYKNHIKERFNHELEEHEDEECSRGDLLHSDHSHGGHALSEHSKDGTEPEIAPIIAKKRKLAEAAEAAAASASTANALDDVSDAACHAHTPPQNDGSIPHSLLGGHHASEDNKILSFVDIKAELNSPTSNGGSKSLLLPYGSGAATVVPQISLPVRSSFAVPIFALHGQGTYYVPLNVDYNALLPYLNGIDLLEKNYAGHMPVVHPININVNFMTTSTAMTTAVTTSTTPATSTTCTSSFLVAATAAQVGKHALQNSVTPIIASSPIAVPAAKAKIETAFTNGW